MTQATRPTEPPRDRRIRLGCVVAIAVMVVLAYADSLGGAFVFDDPSSIALNPSIRSFSPPWAPLFPPANKSLTVSGRPILNLSFALNYAVGGTAVGGYHLVNVAIHLACALLLFGLLRRLLCGPILGPRFGADATVIAGCASALWAAHPLMTEAVTYVVQRAESLSSLFYLGILYAVARLAEGASPRVWMPLAWTACLLGVGTKEIVVSAPLIAFLMDATFFSGSFAGAWRARRGLYAGLALGWVLLAVLVLGDGGNRGGSIGFGIGISWWSHLLTQAPAFETYLARLVWPSPLTIDYDPAWVSFPDAALPLIVIVMVLAACLWGGARRSAAPFAGLFTFAILAPTSLMPAPAQFTCEHRMYLPAAALIALAVVAAYRYLGRWSLMAWTVVVPVAALATAERNLDYRTELALWSDTVAKQPTDAVSREMLAESLDNANRHEDALRQREQGVGLYRGESAGLAITECLLGQDLCLLGRRQEAIPHFEHAIAVRPDYSEAMVFYGVCLEGVGKPREAAEVLGRAVKLNAGNEEALYNDAAAQAELGHHDEAVRLLGEALKLKPDHYEAHYNRANSLAALGRHTEAIAEFESALRLRPDSAKAQYNLAGSYLALGRLDEAISHLKAAVLADPRYYDARCNLAIALEQTGKLQEALEQYEAAQALSPGSAELDGSIRRLKAQLSLSDRSG